MTNRFLEATLPVHSKKQSDVDDAEGTVTFKEFRFGRNFG
jgi:hypothetical protein